MGGKVPEAIAKRITSVRLATGLVLAGFLLNAGIIVVIVGLISVSVPASLVALGFMAALIVVLLLFTELLQLRSTGARPLLPGEFPWLRPMMEGLANRSGISTPAVLIVDEDHQNAFTTGTGNGAKVAFYRGLLESLPRQEVEAVAAHELGHVVNRDISLALWTAAIIGWVVTVRTIAIAFVWGVFAFSVQLARSFDDMGPLGTIFGLVLAAMGLAFGAFLWVAVQLWALFAAVMQMAIYRQREFLADVTGAAIVGKPDRLASALAHIARGPAMQRGAGAVSSLCIVSPGLTGGWWDDLMATHPPIERRIEELMKLPASDSSEALGRDWHGLGSFSLVLPAGAIVLIALLALSVPLFTHRSSTDQGAGSSSSGSVRNEQRASNNLPQAQAQSVPGTIASPSPRSTVLAVVATPKPLASQTPYGPPASPMAYGQIVHGNIVSREQVDAWTFAGQAGDIVTIRMTQEASASLDLDVALKDPGGVQLQVADCGGTSRPEARIQNYTLLHAGAYTIRASGCSNSTGGYQLNLLLKPPPGIISYGQSVTGSIAISNDYEAWTFAGQVGDIVTIRMTQEASASLDLDVAIKDPGGVQLEVAGCGGTSRAEARIQNYTLQHTGTYTIRASGCSNSTGSYQLNLLLKPPPGAIVYGQSVSGSITISNDYQDWTFTGQAGDIITIRMTQGASASLDLDVSLKDPGGVQLQVAGCGGTSRPEARILNYTLQHTGTYTIRASGCSNSTGSYGLSLTRG